MTGGAYSHMTIPWFSDEGITSFCSWGMSVLAQREDEVQRSEKKTFKKERIVQCAEYTACRQQCFRLAVQTRC